MLSGGREGSRHEDLWVPPAARSESPASRIVGFMSEDAVHTLRVSRIRGLLLRGRPMRKCQSPEPLVLTIMLRAEKFCNDPTRLATPL
jgi:hypothetical protein